MEGVVEALTLQPLDLVSSAGPDGAGHSRWQPLRTAVHLLRRLLLVRLYVGKLWDVRLSRWLLSASRRVHHELAHDLVSQLLATPFRA